MIKLIDKAKGREDRSYLNAAFSGSYYGGGMDNRVDPYLYRKFAELGAYYKQYLNKVGLSKEDLNKDDTKFIILEVCHHCSGLKSFLSFFEGYKKQPDVIYLQSNFFEPAYLPVKNKRIAINDQENKLTVALANADRFKDRLVPQFQFHRWQTVDPFNFQSEENAPKILERLEQFVKEEANE